MLSKPPPLDEMIEGSAALHVDIRAHLDGTELDTSHRTDIAAVLCGLTFEHAHSMLVLIAEENASSALALVRVQFEALVRAFWIHFAATDERIAKVLEPHAPDLSVEPDVFPTVSKMLVHLEGKAPPTVVHSLTVYKSMAWNAMNSYTHGSLRPMIRFRNGYAPELLSQTLQNANGAQMFAAMLLAQLSNDVDTVNGVVAISRKHASVLPPLLK